MPDHLNQESRAHIAVFLPKALSKALSLEPIRIKRVYGGLAGSQWGAGMQSHKAKTIID